MGIAGSNLVNWRRPLERRNLNLRSSPAPSSSSTTSTRSHLTLHRQHGDPIYDEFTVPAASHAPPLTICCFTPNPLSRPSKSSRSPASYCRSVPVRHIRNNFQFAADNLHRQSACQIIDSVSDEGMTNGPPIFAYLVFGPGRVSHERLSRPIKAVAWRGLGAIRGVQARFRGVQVRLVLG
jgi:hypothetical protein